MGSQTEAGTAGRVLRVTHLGSDGPGSLRDAVEAEGPRLVVFDAGGVIDLRGRTLTIRNPHLTIAGQTAPDPGITLIRGGLAIETHDVIVAHIAVRPGDGGSEHLAGEWSPDAIGARRSSAGPVHDVIFDHCSATWAIDENLSVSGPADLDTSNGGDATSYDVTLRRCLIAEGLSHSTHPKGEHSKGTLIHDGVRNVTIAGCLYAHNRERNPRLKGGTTSVVIDTLMYDWNNACVGIGARGNARMLQPAETVLSGNLAIAGPDTTSRVFVKSADPGGRAFLRDNIMVDSSGAALPLADSGVVQLTEPPAWSPRLPLPRSPWPGAAGALRCAGSRPARRDPIDTRIVQSVIRGDGRIIDSQEQVGGYPVRPARRRTLEVPDDIDARRRWLAARSDALSTDTTLDLTPLWKRLHVETLPGWSIPARPTSSPATSKLHD